VSKAPGQPLEMEEVEVAPPRAHEVRVKIICTSLCHTDVTFWRMKVRMQIAEHPCGHAGCRASADSDSLLSSSCSHSHIDRALGGVALCFGSAHLEEKYEINKINL
jgi:hypothetical protein